MPKLPMPEDDVLFKGEWLTIRAIRRRNGRMPAVEWWESIDKKGRARFLAAAEIVQNTLRSGRPPAGRLDKVQTSRVGLLELRVTPQGATPPHLRVLVVRRGATLWAASGFTKQRNKLSRQDIQLAEGIVSEWLEEEEQK